METILPIEILDRLSLCLCGRKSNDDQKIRATYFCDIETCKFNKEQPYYCELCMSRDRHNHLPERIHTRVAEEEKEW